MQAFARAVEGGVPIEAATVMVLLFALTRVQQPQLAEAVFCTAFGMFANLQPLLSMPWESSTETNTSSQPLACDPMPCGVAFSSSSEGTRSSKESSRVAGCTSNDASSGQVHTLFSVPPFAESSATEAHCSEAQLSRPGLSECPATSDPASAANSACPSAAATPSAGTATPVSQAMPIGASPSPSRATKGSRSSELLGALAPEDSPQSLLARILDLYKLLIENQACAKATGGCPQFLLGLVPDPIMILLFGYALWVQVMYGDRWLLPM